MNIGCHRARIIAAAVFSSILFLAACGGQHTNPPVPNHSNGTSSAPAYANGAPGNDVAVFADDSNELATRIDAALKAGLHPKFVQVSAQKRTYLFPVYAQVLRSQRALIVRAYGHVYVYRLDSVRVRYATQAVDTANLPQVTATLIDKDIAAGKQAGQFNLNSKAKLRLCPDCTELLLYQPQVLKLASAWNGKLDYWQVDPDYVPWAPPSSGPTGRRTMCTVGGSTIACVYSHCSTCYTGTGYTPTDNTNPTGGGSVASNPTPSPTPCSQTGNSAFNNLENSDNHVKQGMTALSNLGYKPNVIATSLPANNAAQYQNGNILWDQTQVNSAVASGQNEGQIGFHEEGHDYYDNNWNFSIPANGLVTVTIGNYSVTYNLTTANGASAFQHMLIHNDLISEYGTDQTGSAWEMFGYFGPTNPNDANVSVTQNGTPVTDRQTAGNNNRATSVAHTNGPATSFASAVAAHGTACAGTAVAGTRTAMLVPPPGGYSVYKPTPSPRPTASAATLARPADFGEIYQ